MSRSRKNALAELLETRLLLAAEDQIITMEVANTPFDESQQNVIYLYRDSGVGFPALSINIEITGVAENGQDYQSVPSTLLIAENSLTGGANIIPIPDNIPEGPEEIRVRLLPGDGYTINPDTPAEGVTHLTDEQITINGLVYFDRNLDGHRDPANEETVNFIGFQHYLNGTPSSMFTGVRLDGTFVESYPILSANDVHEYRTIAATGLDFDLPKTFTLNITTEGDKTFEIGLTKQGNAAKITGSYFVDNDYNGSFTPEIDTTNSEVIVNARDLSGNVVATTQAGSDGRYSLNIPEGLLPGNFTVEAVVQNVDFFDVVPLNDNTLLLDAGAEHQVNFILKWRSGTVTVHTAEDRDANQTGDVPLRRRVQLWKIGLDRTPNTADDRLMQQKTTDRTGTATFTVDPIDTTSGAEFFVKAIDGPANLIATSQSDVFRVSNGETVSRDLLYSRPARISGRLFLDRDGNGERSAGDTGIGGYRVQLFLDGQLVQTDFTTSNGTYVFLRVAPGNYELRIIPPDSTTPVAAPGNPRLLFIKPGDDFHEDFFATTIGQNSSVRAIGDQPVAIVPGNVLRLSRPIQFQIDAGAGTRNDQKVQFVLKNANDSAAAEIPVKGDVDVKLNADKSRRVLLKNIQVEGTFGPGDYTLSAKTNPSSAAIEDFDLSDNTVSYSLPLKYRLGAGTFYTGFARSRTAFTFNNSQFRIAHSGPGFTQVDPQDNGGFNVISEGTTWRSSVALKSDRAIGEINFEDPVGKFVGHFDVIGNVDFKGGIYNFSSVGSYLSGSTKTINIGAADREIVARFGSVYDRNITFHSPVRRFSAEYYGHTTGTTTIFSPAFRGFQIAQSFMGNITTDDGDDEMIGLKHPMTIDIFGRYSGMTSIDGPVTRFRAGAVQDSEIRTRGDDSYIGTFILRDKVTPFANTDVISPRFGPIRLGHVTFNNSDNPFGFISKQYRDVRFLDDDEKTAVIKPTSPGVLNKDDFWIRLDLEFRY